MVGERISHYEITAFLGRGGMGEVYLAYDTRLRRQVALKVFRDGANQQASERFMREAQLASAVNHPNVAHIYETGESDGVRYIAMEYVEGTTLAAHIGDRPLPTPQVVALAIQIAEALDEAHGRGVIHRDIKPANIMLSPRGSVKVLDFGLATVDDTSRSIASLSTMSGTMVGTVTYMSPEQALGERIDGRSDIYTLGVVMYEMLTGRVPFTGSTVASVLTQLLHDSPQPVSSLNASVPRALQDIVLRCLEKDPVHRYQNAAELLDDLRLVAQDPAVRLKKPIGRKRRRRSLLWAAAGIVLLITTGAIVAYTGLRARQAVVSSIAVLPFPSSGTAGDEAESIGDGIAETLINRLSRFDNLRVISRPTAFAYEIDGKTPQQIGKELRAEALVTGRVDSTGERVEVQVELIDAGEDRQIWGERYSGTPYDLIRIQDDIAAALAKELRIPSSEGERHFVRTAMTTDPEAFRSYMLARHLTSKRTTASLRQSITYYEAALKRDPKFALAHAGLAESYLILVGKHALDTREGYEKARVSVARALQLDPYSAEAHTLMADIRAYAHWDWKGAEHHFERAIALNPHYITARHWYALYLNAIGQTTRGLEQMRIAQQLDPGTPRYISAYGSALFAARRYEEAERELLRALEADPGNSTAWDGLASVYLAQGRTDESVEAFAKSLKPEIARKVRDAYAEGGYKGMRAAILKDRQRRANEGGYVSPTDWAVGYMRLGDFDRAFHWLEVMYEERSTTLLRLRTSPIFDPLRSDPRYWDLVRRIGLPEPENGDVIAPPRPLPSAPPQQPREQFGT